MTATRLFGNLLDSPVMSDIASPSTASRRRKLAGISHAHSENSFDAHCTYPELRLLFMSKGLNFACMTEHIEYLEQSDIDRIVRQCREASDDQFLFIPGIEMDCWVVYFLGIKDPKVDFADNRTIYESLKTQSRLCVLSHPIKAKFSYPDWILTDCDAVEIMNNKHDGKFYFRPQSEALLRRIRQTKPDVVPIVGMDFHAPEQLCDVHMRLTREGPLDADFILGEIRAARIEVFAGHKRLTDLGVAGRMLGRARIYLMDLAHFVHRTIRKGGFRIPRAIRKPLSRLLEGG